MSLFTSGNMPGHTAAITANSTQPYFGGRQGETDLADYPVVIASTAVDSGNDLTTTLRGGLVMVQLSTGLVTTYSNSSGGRIIGILPTDVNMLVNGVATARHTNLFVAGRLRASEIPNLDYFAASALLAQGFIFDNPLYNGPMNGFTRSTWVTADTTLTAADHGTRFCTFTANIDFTLPTIARGLSFEFLSTTATATIVSPAADLIICAASDATAANSATTVTLTDFLFTVHADYCAGLSTPALMWICNGKAVPAALT